MRASLRLALSAFVLQIAFFLPVINVAPAAAGDVTVTSPDLAQLPPDKQKELVTELKKRGLLAEGDTVVNNAPPAEDRRSIGAGILLALVPAACKMIAETKKADELAHCMKLKTPDEQSGCKTKAEAAFGSIDTVCSLIKLF